MHGASNWWSFHRGHTKINVRIKKLKYEIEAVASVLNIETCALNLRKSMAILQPFLYILQKWYICHSNHNKKRGNLMGVTFLRGMWI